MHQIDQAMEDEERGLWSAFKTGGSLAARASLFARFSVFARGIARRHHRERSRGDIDLAEVQQLAYTGLLEALDRFDPERGVPFRSFAAHRISGCVRDGIAQMSETREQLSWRYRAQRERIVSLRDADIPEQDTSQAMSRLVDIAIGLAIGFMLEDTGLFVADETDSSSHVRSTAYDSLAWKQIVGQLQAEIDVLPGRERDILCEHYMNGVGFEQLALLFGVTKGRISQLHRAALETLRKRLRQRGHHGLGRLP